MIKFLIYEQFYDLKYKIKIKTKLLLFLDFNFSLPRKLEKEEQKQVNNYNQSICILIRIKEGTSRQFKKLVEYLISQYSTLDLLQKEKIAFRIFVLKPHSGPLESTSILMDLIDEMNSRVLNSVLNSSPNLSIDIQLFYDPDYVPLETEEPRKSFDELDDIDHFLQYLANSVS